MVSGSHRRKTHAAVAHHHGGNAVVTRWRHAIRPGRLSVVVGVNIDEARSDQCTVGADFLCTMARHLPTSIILPSVMATSAVKAGWPVPSITEPDRITKLCCDMLSLPCCLAPALLRVFYHRSPRDGRWVSKDSLFKANSAPCFKQVIIICFVLVLTASLERQHGD